MSFQDIGKQKAEIEKQLQKFSELMPSLRPLTLPIKRVLVLIDGSPKSRSAVLVAENLNKNFGSKIDVVCFYAHAGPETATNKEFYETSLSYAYEHLKSKDFEIKGQVVENIEALQEILSTIIESASYDLIVVPSSFIGIYIGNEADLESEAKISIMGDIFEYLLEKTSIPILLIESEKINYELLWRHTLLFVGHHSLLKHALEKAIQFSLERSEIHAIINLVPAVYSDKTPEEFQKILEKQGEEMHIFEKANAEVLKEINRFVDFKLISTEKIEDIKELIQKERKEISLIAFYIPTKYSSIYAMFLDILNDPEIAAPLLILKGEQAKIEVPEEEKKIIEARIEKEKEELKVSEKIIEEIKEEVKEAILGEKEEDEKEKKEREEKEEKVSEPAENIEIEKEKEKCDEKDKIEVRDISSIDEIKEEAKRRIIEDIKKEVKADIKEEPKRELKKSIERELKRYKLEDLKEEIIEEIKNELKEEILFELKKELKEPKEELKEAIKEELLKEEAKAKEKETKKEQTSESDEDEEEIKKNEFE